MSKALLLCYSNTGNTTTFVDFIKKHFNGEIVERYKMEGSFDGFDKIFLASSTWGVGKIPSRIKKNVINNHKGLKGKEVFIFGSGNTIYPNFCRAVDSLKTICEDSGAKVIGTYKFEQRFVEKDVDKQELEEVKKIISNWNS